MAQMDSLTYKLLQREKNTGCPIVMDHGQRKFGPPSDWQGLPPPKGSEVFITKLPRMMYENQLVPVFSSVGKIYEMRLMMNLSGSNRGYAYVTYSTPSEANAAIRNLNDYEIIPHRHIRVVKSVEKCKLYVCSIPRDRTQQELHEELCKRVNAIIKVEMPMDYYENRQNRGYAFVEFASHRAAAVAKSELLSGYIKIWDKYLITRWADPKPRVNEKEMMKVKALHVKNFHSTPEVIQTIFESAIDHQVQSVKKIYDYAFINFYERQHAEIAMAKLQNAEIDGNRIVINWAIPCVEKRKYYYSPNQNEGIGSRYTRNSISDLPPYASSSTNFSPLEEDNQLMLAPSRREANCERSSWTFPMYEYHKRVDYLWTAERRTI